MTGLCAERRTSASFLWLRNSAVVIEAVIERTLLCDRREHTEASVSAISTAFEQPFGVFLDRPDDQFFFLAGLSGQSRGPVRAFFSRRRVGNPFSASQPRNTGDGAPPII
jgi:hypothetical protein